MSHATQSSTVSGQNTTAGVPFQKPVTPFDVAAEAVGIEAVIIDECAEIQRLCHERGVRAELNKVPSQGVPERFALAFSGGGIRSASVNMGLMQALARSGFLRQAHYISGVSGGGYILGWITAWIARRKFDAVESELAKNAEKPDAKLASGARFNRYLEPNPIHFLRRYVSYLVPRSGLSSGDTLAAIAIYLRNVLLIQTMLAAALIAIMAVLQMAAPAMMWGLLLEHGGRSAVLWSGAALASFLGLAVWSPLALLAHDASLKSRRYWAMYARILGTLLCVAIWAGFPVVLETYSCKYGKWMPAIFAAVAGSVFFFLEWIVSSCIQIFRYKGEKEILQGVRPGSAWWARLLASAGAGCVTALMTEGFWNWLHADTGILVTGTYGVLGLPVILAAAALVSFLYVGIYGDAFPDGKREWLGRLAGYFLFFAAIAGIVSAVALLGPLGMEWVFRSPHEGWKSAALKWVLPGGWIATTLGGVFAGKSPATGNGSGDKASGNTSSSSSLMELLASVAPPIFLLGMMLCLSWATHALALHFDNGREYLTFGSVHPTPLSGPNFWVSFEGTPCAGDACAAKDKVTAMCPRCSEWDAQPMSSLNQIPYGRPWGTLGCLFVFGGLLTWLLAKRLSVNEFSLHLFYRNRLVRTFLGASNVDGDGVPQRRPDPFTGFALDDDHYLGSLRDFAAGGEGVFNGPYPLWCTALNLTAGEDLAWQKRKASSFLYSPLYCGWDYMPSSAKERATDPVGDAYRAVAPWRANPPRDIVGYGGKGGAPLIGTAMAASGAAISPNWGYHTKPAIAALLAMFNVRIGWWTGNPRDHKGYKKYAPGALYFLSELFGSAGEDDDFVYISDGGHFENLGIYELVRRRVKFIIACDADADPSYTFGDLANMVEKCRVDFGVQIEMSDYSTIKPASADGLSATHFAVGKIHYLPLSKEEGSTMGWLLYVKNSLIGDEPPQVLGQRAADSKFPHDTTLNQFFNETQFEAYRALGESMGTFLQVHYEKFLDERRKLDPKAQPSTWGNPVAWTMDERAERVRDFFEGFLDEAYTKPWLLAGPNEKAATTTPGQLP
jgi:hypothetical protein